MATLNICTILGVNPYEKFSFGAYKDIYVDTGGQVRLRASGGLVDSAAICEMINYPEQIKRENKWSGQDIEDAKYIKRLFPEVHILSRAKAVNQYGCGLIARSKNWDHHVSINPDLFPNLLPGEEIELDQIIAPGGAV